MAVLDAYIDANLAAGKKGSRSKISGAPTLTIAQTFEVAAGDSNLSVWRLGILPANAIPVRCEIYCDASLGTSEFDLGLYKPGVGGAVVDRDLFMDGVDLTSGVAVTAGANNGLANLGGADPVAAQGKKLWELLGLSVPGRNDYDLALTGVVAGAAAGTISVVFEYIIG
jgi:hypothetical protein